MSNPNGLPSGCDSPPTFDSLTADLIVVEGNEDTTVRPIPPGLRASHAAYRELLAGRATPRPEAPQPDASPG